MAHKYEVHQTIRLSTEGKISNTHLSPDGMYEIMRLLPQDQAGDFYYRIRSSAGERVVLESQILTDADL